MVRGHFLVLAVVALSCLSSARSGPVTKCKIDDSKCMKNSAQAILPAFASGLSEHQVKTIDPMIINKVDASSPNLKLILNDITVTGLKDCLVKKLKWDLAVNKIFMKFHCSCQLEGQYDMKGQMLILPIEGKGPLHVTLRKIEVNTDTDMGEIEKDGVKYWEVKGWKYNYSLKDKATVVFDNLFDGNEILAQAAREMVSNSGNEIILEIGSPVMDAVIDKIFSNVKSFFQNIPASELTED